MLFRYSIKNGKQQKQAKIYTEGEHGIDFAKVDRDAVKIIRKLVMSGFDAYLVGGAVRDLVIGRAPKDFDITTNAEPKVIRKLFANSRIIGKRFQLVHIFFGKKIIEVSTFRSTENGSVGNQFGTIEQDAHRRDFSINTMYFDPLTEQLIDFVDGFRDLHNRKLKPVIPLKRLFSEDPVRMLRAVKYSVLAECKMGFLLKSMIRLNAHRLEQVSPSRLTEEMNKILHSGHSAQIIESLVDFGLFNYLQPNACVFIDENTADFRTKYFSSLRELDTAVEAGNAERQGDQLYYVIADFLQMIFDGMGKQTPFFFYTEARRFIMPLSPQREELKCAVMSFLRKNKLAKAEKKPQHKKHSAGVSPQGYKKQS